MPEPWEVLEGQEQLLAIDAQREALRRDGRHFRLEMPRPRATDVIDVCLGVRYGDAIGQLTHFLERQSARLKRLRHQVMIDE